MSLLDPMKRKLLGMSEGFTYRGVPMQKNPIDLAIYSMLIWDLKPKTIIEIGANAGGSAMWLSDQMALYGDRNVISVDKNIPAVVGECVNFIQADARTLNLQLHEEPHPWLVIEDSAHDYETTIAVLEFFNTRLHVDDYVVVEDLHVAPVEFAVKNWMSSNPGFRVDHRYQDFWGFSDHYYMRVHR